MNDHSDDQPTPAPSDQRRSLRSPLLILKVRLDDGRTCFFGYAKNLSRSGMFIATANPRAPGSRFQVEIPLPAPVNRTARCTCEVVWERRFSPKSPYEPGMGLRFIDLADDVASAIHTWVENQVD